MYQLYPWLIFIKKFDWLSLIGFFSLNHLYFIHKTEYETLFKWIIYRITWTNYVLCYLFVWITNAWFFSFHPSLCLQEWIVLRSLLGLHNIVLLVFSLLNMQFLTQKKKMQANMRIHSHISFSDSCRKLRSYSIRGTNWISTIGVPWKRRQSHQIC